MRFNNNGNVAFVVKDFDYPFGAHEWLTDRDQWSMEDHAEITENMKLTDSLKDHSMPYEDYISQERLVGEDFIDLIQDMGFKILQHVRDYYKHIFFTNIPVNHFECLYNITVDELLCNSFDYQSSKMLYKILKKRSVRKVIYKNGFVWISSNLLSTHYINKVNSRGLYSKESVFLKNLFEYDVVPYEPSRPIEPGFQTTYRAIAKTTLTERQYRMWILLVDNFQISYLRVKSQKRFKKTKPKTPKNNHPRYMKLFVMTPEDHDKKIEKTMRDYSEGKISKRLYIKDLMVSANY